MHSEKMRAVRIVAYGGIDVLEIEEIERPRATANRVLVRVRAAALNRADILQRRGRYPAPAGTPSALSDVPGLEFAGEVESAGEEVTRWRAGQRVFGITAGGAQAEYTVVPEDGLVEIPANLSWTEAAAVPEVFITAHDALITQARLQMGEQVIIHAAGSGVGTAAVQLARAAGARAFGTTRTAEKLERARAFGLDAGAVIENDPREFVETVREWSAGVGANVILDTIGASYLAANLEAIAALGRLILVGTLGGASATLDFSTVMRKRLHIIGTILRSRSAEEKARAVRLFAQHVVPLLANEMVRPVIDKVYPMTEVRAAHERLESNEGFGKIVLMIGED
jgi:NADPH:quinone reductase